MDDESRAAFGRIERYLELAQAQHLEFRADFNGLKGEVAGLRGEVGELRGEVGELRGEVGALRTEVRELREWVTLQFAELRSWLRDLTRRVEALEHR